LLVDQKLIDATTKANKFDELEKQFKDLESIAEANS
jgi:hypothetical protein